MRASKRPEMRAEIRITPRGATLPERLALRSLQPDALTAAEVTGAFYAVLLLATGLDPGSHQVHLRPAGLCEHALALSERTVGPAPRSTQHTARVARDDYCIVLRG